MSSLLSVALISQFKLKQYAVRPLHSGQCRNGPSADAGTLAWGVRCPFNQDIPGFPHNKRSKNERLPLLHFAFFLLHFGLLLSAFVLVTFFWRPKESNQRKGSGYASVPKIALHSVAQNKLAFRS